MPSSPGRILLALAGLCAITLAATGCAHLTPVMAGGEAFSVGSPSGGWLLGAAHLAERGPGYTVHRADDAGGQHWGTGRVVDMVQGAARYVARRNPRGAPLVVGDLSGRRGGKIPHHRSHRNGRDVDLLYFALDASGASVPSPGFLRYNRAGVSLPSPDAPTPLRLDVPRNWDLVEALVRNERAGVVRIFCARWIRQLLLDHAMSERRPAWVIERADTLLAQPGDSFPHDDHFHVRVACTPTESAHGCIHSAPIWPWLAKEWEKGDSAPADDEAILAALDDLPPGVMHGPPLPPAPESEPESEPVASSRPSAGGEALPPLCTPRNPAFHRGHLPHLADGDGFLGPRVAIDDLGVCR